MKSYPTPILDYRQARQQRVEQLEKQRSRFRQRGNVVPYLAALPTDLTPFGSDRYLSEIGWVQSPPESLFPAALDLSALDDKQAIALRTWFVAHVNITPPKTRKRPPQSPDYQLALNF